MTPECKTCEHLIEKYGYCPVIEDWVGPLLLGDKYERRWKIW